MKKLEIVERNVLDNDYILFPTSYVNPLADMALLEKELKGKIGIRCKVLVDLLLCNGNNFNRFVRLEFDGISVINKSIQITSLNDAEEKDVNEFYRDHKNLIGNGVLTPSEYLRYVK